MNRSFAMVLLVCVTSPAAQALQVLQQEWFSDTPYLQRGDGPLAASPTTFMLENFEDGLFDLPGVTASTGHVLAPGPDTDSVDGDDGAVDGQGNGGFSFQASSGLAGITFTFDAATLGGLPRSVGVVWTDGASNSALWLEAFDPHGVSYGYVGSEPQGDDDFLGGTAEDRFLGVLSTAPVGSLRIWTVPLDGRDAPMEIDHLQFGNLTSWFDVGEGLAGTFGVPTLEGTGSLQPDSLTTLTLEPLPTAAPGVLVVGLQRLDTPLLGGVLVPTLDALVPGVSGDDNGHWSAELRWPAALVPALPVYFQVWTPDPAAPAGWSASNALQAGGVP